MKNKNTLTALSGNKLRNLWHFHNASIVLIILLTIYMAYAIFIALNIKPGIVPDEPAHLVFSQHYSSTWGIPPDVPETYTLGWYIEQNPFLYYWINGRIINFLELVAPSIDNWQVLVTLRLVNAFYGLGTVFFCFLLSKIIIKHKWWQLAPVFLLTNTLMFVFLTGGVNYDNLANLFSMAGLYFLVRVFNDRAFVSNSLGWMLCISAGTLVKYPILPLALAMGITWIIYIIKKKNQVFPLLITGKKDLLLSTLLLVLVVGNLAVYGYNLVKYQAIRPPCMEILTEDQCRINPYVNRFNELALDRKLTITESIRLGYPDPVSYLIDSWIPNMFYRIFGILGQQSYFPARIIIFYRLLFYWMILLIVRNWRQPSFTTLSLIGIFLFYAAVLFFTNYNSELVYGFRQIALQGRYIFPVLGIVYVLFTGALERIPKIYLVIPTLIWTFALFIYGGPLKFLLYYQTIFSTWFVR